MNYSSSITFLESLQKFGADSSLTRVQTLLDILGNPEKKMQYVHVTGTNGKGSTCAAISSILTTAGYRNGLFTSPHLWKYTERIQIDGLPISDNDFGIYAQRVQSAITQMTEHDAKMAPANFEALVVMALLYFAEQDVEIAVIEVGIGGTHDSTNVIDGIVSVITNVDRDHCDTLGNTKAEIAEQKCGIIKPHSIVVNGEQDPQIQNKIRHHAKEKNAQYIVLDPQEIHFHSQDMSGQIFDMGQWENIHIPLLGSHQRTNTSLALLVADALNAKGFSISPSHIRQGLAHAKWPLRLEIVHSNPPILIDVGHNPHGLRSAHAFVQEFFAHHQKTLIFGASYDKPWQEMAQIVIPEMHTIILTQAKYKGISSPEILSFLTENNLVSPSQKLLCTPTVAEAITTAKKLATSPHDAIAVLGGLYLGAEAYEAVQKM